MCVYIYKYKNKINIICHTTAVKYFIINTLYGTHWFLVLNKLSYLTLHLTSSNVFSYYSHYDESWSADHIHLTRTPQLSLHIRKLCKNSEERQASYCTIARCQHELKKVELGPFSALKATVQVKYCAGVKHVYIIKSCNCTNKYKCHLSFQSLPPTITENEALQYSLTTNLVIFENAEACSCSYYSTEAGSLRFLKRKTAQHQRQGLNPELAHCIVLQQGSVA